ncbi:MAG: class I SAM-dependent methyltransferase [Deltaproteobacteria bacterium]|nr:MAG: class I SAM-dependent methyltransferase [Deltaproteobacteria bacterium]
MRATLWLESLGAVACEPHREGPGPCCAGSCAATVVPLQNLLGAGEVDCTRFEILARSLRARPRVRKYSHDLYEHVLESGVRGDTEWLDLGCGHQILPLWRAEQEKRLVERCRSVVGIDADRPSLSKHRSIKLRVAGNIGRLPWRDESFTLVTANMVVEHLDAPGAQFAEIARVLKPGGVFIMHTPNRRGYSTIAARLIPERIKKRLVYLLEQREAADVFRTFYRANTRDPPSGARAALDPAAHDELPQVLPDHHYRGPPEEAGLDRCDGCCIGATRAQVHEVCSEPGSWSSAWYSLPSPHGVGAFQPCLASCSY